MRPRYLTDLSIGIIWLFILTGGIILGLWVKVMRVDLFSLILIFHKVNLSWVRWSWRLLTVVASSELVEIMAVSSVKVARAVIIDWGKSTVYIL